MYPEAIKKVGRGVHPMINDENCSFGLTKDQSAASIHNNVDRLVKRLEMSTPDFEVTYYNIVLDLVCCTTHTPSDEFGFPLDIEPPDDQDFGNVVTVGYANTSAHETKEGKKLKSQNYPYPVAELANAITQANNGQRVVIPPTMMSYKDELIKEEVS